MMTTPRITSARVNYVRRLLDMHVSHRNIADGYKTKFGEGISLKTITRIKQDPAFAGAGSADQGDPGADHLAERLKTVEAIAGQYDRLFMAFNRELKVNKQITVKAFISLVKSTLNLEQIDEYKRGAMQR